MAEKKVNAGGKTAEKKVEKPAAVTKPVTKQTTKNEAKPAVKAEVKPAKPAVKAEVKPAAKPVVKPATKAEVKPAPKTEKPVKEEVKEVKPAAPEIIYHISKRQEDRKWQVKAEGAAKALKLFFTQDEAIDYARTVAGNKEGRIVIHKSDGTVKVAAKPADAPDMVYHISKRQEDRKWQVRAEGATKVLKLFFTQAEAIEYAKTVAGNREGRIVIHKEDGSFRKLKY